MNTATDSLNNLPLSNRLLKSTHETLLHGVRGEFKQPGEFRLSQNWIGGSNLDDATFIPPHHDGVPDLMSDLEKFWHNECIQVPHLIRIAISHYQFETIHPFLDGNGRIGRLLIPLYLMSHGLLAKPALYLSDFFEQNRASYYDALMRVRLSNDLCQWIRFFLNGIQQTASKGARVFKEILELRTRVEQNIMDMGKRVEIAQQALNFLYKRPVVDASDLEKSLDVTTPTANRLIKTFVQKGILSERTGQQRDRVYSFEAYLSLFVQ